ncbi:hypothetical protein CNMCM5793_004941 [Aspergillus hiratsukae]|uniref:Trans-sialidase n=1 Tax=Aspergillus hiratsukae TaxID=1194566 RepID=A0A8H6QAX0_9EURO|nr:hypothetical protein CNMCM5793_004941 [Aspergillus hiratsukae]KAF7170355.1 hypothetical protein CNMCM6106_005062 [Aspergillus hiratsukae]
MDGPPPPPPPHGENPNTTHGFKRESGLPEGNYDIFIIPPHSSGSGFLYLPSLQTHRNSFLAGAASALVLVYIWQTLSPIVKAWYLATAANGGGMGVAVLLAVVGIAGWGFGAYQAHVAGTKRESGGTSQSRQSGPGGPGAAGGSSYHQPSGAGPGPGPGYSTGPNFGGPNPGPQGTYGSGGNYGAGPGPGGPYPGNQYGAGAAPPHTPPPNADPGPEKAEQSESKSKSGEDWERAREETRRKEELKRKMEEFKRKREAEAREKQKQREREAMERELRERKEQLEREMAAAKEKAEREARERAEKEAAEARAKIERELAEAKAKAEREAAEARAERLAALAKEREARAKEKAEKEAAEKEAAAKEAAKREADAKFAALKEAAAKKYAEKKAKDAKEAAAKEEATPKAASNKSATASTAPRTPSPKKPTPADQDDAYSFRPYDRPRRPYAGTTGSPSVYSESSYAPSQSTARTTPPPSTRGAYSTKDPDKIVIRGVYAFNNAFMRSPVAQLVSGQGMVTDGLVLRITTEGLFIDDDIRGVPQREWDVKAWTMKLVEVWCPQYGATQGRPNPKPANVFFRRSTNEPTPEESDANLINFLKVCKNKCRLASPDEEEQGGLHVLRASIRDQEGRRYVFVLQETEGWKVAVGLQRLRKGNLVRGLGVIGMAGNECRTLLGNLGYA